MYSSEILMHDVAIATFAGTGQHKKTNEQELLPVSLKVGLRNMTEFSKMDCTF